jgi:hypothetical protein
MSRKQWITAVARASAALGKVERKRDEIESKASVLRWTMAEKLVGLRGTFEVGQEKAFLATAATAAERSEDVVRDLVKAYEVRETLTPAHREQTADWPTDTVLRGLRGLDTAKRTKVIAKATAAGTSNVKTVTGIRKDVTGTKTRTRQTSNETLAKLVKLVGPKLVKAIMNGHDPITLAAGARLAQDNPGDISSAILFVAKNDPKVVEYLAKVTA